MGANSKQGWFLFLFMIGFTFLVAGLAYLGFVFGLAGLVCLIAALIGFHQIKPLENDEQESSAASTAPSAVKARVV